MQAPKLTVNEIRGQPTIEGLISARIASFALGIIALRA